MELKNKILSIFCNLVSEVNGCYEGYFGKTSHFKTQFNKTNPAIYAGTPLPGGGGDHELA